jgi:hypothetical protein
MCIHMYMCMYMYTYMFVCMYMYMHTYVYVCVCICMCIHVCIRTLHCRTCNAFATLRAKMKGSSPRNMTAMRGSVRVLSALPLSAQTQTYVSVSLLRDMTLHGRHSRFSTQKARAGRNRNCPSAVPMCSHSCHVRGSRSLSSMMLCQCVCVSA